MVNGEYGNTVILKFIRDYGIWIRDYEGE